MPATLNFTIPHPIPPSLTPTTVLRALQTYEPLVTANPYLVSFRRRAVDVDEIIDDPFFREDGVQLAAFEVVDKIILVPGLASKEITIPCVMQSFAGGVRCRSYAQGGVRVWSTWTLRPRPPPPEPRQDLDRGAAQPLAARGRAMTETLGAPSRDDEWRSGSSHSSTVSSGLQGGDWEWELVEDARVECSSLVKPFVGKSFVRAHKTILKRIVDQIVRGSATGKFAAFGFEQR